MSALDETNLPEKFAVPIEDDDEIIIDKKEISENIPVTSTPSSEPAASPDPIKSSENNSAPTSSSVPAVEEATRAPSVKDKIKMLSASASNSRNPSTADSAPKFGQSRNPSTAGSAPKFGQSRNPSTADSAPKFGQSRNPSTAGTAPKFDSNRSVSTTGSNWSSSRNTSTAASTAPILPAVNDSSAASTAPTASEKGASVSEADETATRVTSVKDAVRKLSEAKPDETAKPAESTTSTTAATTAEPVTADAARVGSLRTSPVRDEIKRPVSVREEAKRLSGALADGQLPISMAPPLRVSPVRDEIKRPVSVKDEAKRFAQLAAETVASAVPSKPAKPQKGASGKIVDSATPEESTPAVVPSTTTPVVESTSTPAFEKRASPEKVFATKVNPGLAARMNKIDPSKIVMQMPGQSYPGRPKSVPRAPDSTETPSAAVPTLIASGTGAAVPSAEVSGSDGGKSGEIVNFNMSRPTIDNSKSQRRKPQRKQFGGDEAVDPSTVPTTPVVIPAPVPAPASSSIPAYNPSVIQLPPLRAPQPKQSFFSKVVSWITGATSSFTASAAAPTTVSSAPSISKAPASVAPVTLSVTAPVIAATPPQKPPMMQTQVSQAATPPQEQKRPVSQTIQPQSQRPVSMALPPTQQQHRPTSQKIDLSERPPSKEEPVVLLPPPIPRGGVPLVMPAGDAAVVKDKRSTSDVMRDLDLLPASVPIPVSAPDVSPSPGSDVAPAITPVVAVEEPVRMTGRPASFSQQANAPRNSRSLSKPVLPEDLSSPSPAVVPEPVTTATDTTTLPPVEEKPAEAAPVAESTATPVEESKSNPPMEPDTVPAPEPEIAPTSVSPTTTAPTTAPEEGEGITDDMI